MNSKHIPFGALTSRNGSRLEPLSRSSRRESALILPKGRWSGLTSAAARFERRTKLSALLAICFLSSVFCPLPSALAGSFSGNARVEISDATGGLSWSNSVNALTVQCWFKLSIPSGLNLSENMTILVNRTNGSISDPHAYHLWYDKAGRNIQFSTKGTTPWQGVLIPKPSMDRWYHVAVVRSGNGLTAYVDGQVVTNTSIAVGDSRSTNGVSIGGWGDAKYLYGEVQEVAIYQLARTATAIGLTMFTDQPTNTSELKGYYKLGYSTNAAYFYRNFANTKPLGTDPAVRAGPGAVRFEETDQKGEQSLFDSQVNGGKNAVMPLSGAFAWQQSVFSRAVPGVPFDLSIAYSQGPGSAALGPGWSHSFNTKVSAEGQTVNKVSNWQGGIETWDTTNNTAGATWITRHGEYRGQLTEDGSGSVFWTNAQQRVYRFEPPRTGASLAGNLTAIRDLNGNSMQIQWDPNPDYARITNVVDSAGGNYRFYYNAQNLLTNVTFGDWQIRFGYTNITVFGQPLDFLASKTLTNTGFNYYNVATTTWRFFYNTNNGLLEKIVNPSGSTNVYVQYDDYGRRTNTFNALGEATRTEYGTPGNRQTRTTDAGGFQWIDTYDRSGRVISQRNPLGHETRYGYDEHGNRTAITDANGNTMLLGYDERGNVLAQTNALGEVTLRTYHPFFNKPLTETDPVGWTTTNSYDPNGNLLARSDVLGPLASYSYTTNGLLRTATDANGHTTTNTYNTIGFVTAQTDTAGATTQFSPNELGWNTQATNALNQASSYYFDFNGKTKLWSDPLGRGYVYVYDASGNVLSQRDAKAQFTFFTYDALGRKTSETDRAGAITRFAYTARGQLAYVTNALGRVTSFQYDAANRRTAVVDALGNTNTTVYDANGNAVATIDPLGRRWSKVVDRLNRVVAEADPLGQVSQTLYDAAGRIREMIAPDGNRTTESYDGRGRLTNWVDAVGSSWGYAYDRGGNLTNVTDAKGGNYAMVYGPRDERVLERNQDGKVWTYTYDPLLRVKTQTEPNGTVRTLTYDVGGRLTNVAFSTGRSDTFQYDNNDNPTIVARTGSGPATASQMTYDSMDRVLQYTDAFAKTISYAYNALGRQTTLTYPDGKTLTQSYDAVDRLTNQVFQFNAQTYTTSYAYDAAGRLVQRTYPNGIVQNNTFDPADQLTGLSHALPSPQVGTLNVALAYAHDRNGSTVRVTELGVFPRSKPADRDEIARYTAAARLIDRQITLSNQLSTIAYQYDNSGNMTNANGGGQTWALTYDEDNRTSSLFWDSGITSKLITNRYDALGRRVARTVDGVETRYVLNLAGDMERTLCDVNPTGTILAWYVHGPDLAFKINVEGSLNCYHTDAQGNVIALTGAGGVNLAEFAYTPYGRSLGSTNYVGLPALETQPFLFVGGLGVMEEQGVPGLYFMRARYYSAAAGVFLSTDPVRNIGPTWRPIAYAYANGNPLRYNDPKGEFGWLVGALVGGGLDLAFQLVENGGNFNEVNWGSVAGSALAGALSGGISTGAKFAALQGGKALAANVVLGAATGAIGKLTEIGLEKGANAFGTSVGSDASWGDVGWSAAFGALGGIGFGGTADDLGQQSLKRAEAQYARTAGIHAGLAGKQVQRLVSPQLALDLAETITLKSELSKRILIQSMRSSASGEVSGAVKNSGLEYARTQFGW